MGVVTESTTPSPGSATPTTALPSVGARVLSVLAILIGGIAGGFIGYGFVDLQVSGDATVWAGLGALVGATAAAVGTAVVVVLTLRAMGEWRTIQAREEARAAAAQTAGGARRVPRVR